MTSIRKPSNALTSMIIHDEKDLGPVLEVLVSIFGLGGGEELRYVNKNVSGGHITYLVRQSIRGVDIPAYVRVRVDLSTATITSVDGLLYSSEGLETHPSTDSNEAIEKVVKHLQHLQEQEQSTLAPKYFGVVGGNAQELISSYDLFGDHAAALVYREYGDSREVRLSWAVGIELNEPFYTPDGEHVRYDWYLVGPDGDVSLLAEVGVA